MNALQEEITQKTLALCVEASKMTAQLLQQAMKKVLADMEKHKKNPQLRHGKQTLRQLMKHNTGVSNIEITDQNRVGFSEVPEFLQERQPELTPDDLEIGECIRTPRGSFYVTAMSREQMEAAGYGVHHISDDGKYLIMGNGTRAFAVAAEQPEKDNPLRTAEMTLEDDYGMIDGVINNGRRGEELEKAQEYAERTTPEKSSIRERLEDAKRECAEHKSPEGKKPGRDMPEHDCL